MIPPNGHPLEDETTGLLLEAAFDLLAKAGWGGFSLRAVADAIGAAGSAASHRFGDRTGLVTAVCAAALARERAQMDCFLPDVQVHTADQLAAALYTWLEQRVRCHRSQVRACSELLLVSYRDPQFGAFGADWIAACRAMIARLHPTLGDEAVTSLAAFLPVEAAWWLLLADDPEFRLSSGEALSRMARMGEGGDTVMPVYWLRRGLAAPDLRLAVDVSGTKQKIVEATARIILESGVQALTHREIARRSETSLSSLTYHFETLNDLIRGGFQAIFAAGTSAPACPARAAAAYELALQALQDPGLRPLAGTVRRRLAAGVFGEAAATDDKGPAMREIQAVLDTAMLLSAVQPRACPKAG